MKSLSCSELGRLECNFSVKGDPEEIRQIMTEHIIDQHKMGLVTDLEINRLERKIGKILTYKI